MIDLYSIQLRLTKELSTLINLEDVVFVARQRGALPPDESALDVLSECLCDAWLRPIADEINVIYENSVHRTYLRTYLQCTNEELNLRLVDLCKKRYMLSAAGKPTDPYMGVSATAAYIIQHDGVAEHPQDISSSVLHNETLLSLARNGRDRCIESKRVLPSVATHIALTKLANSQLGIQGFVTYFPLDTLTATAPTLYTGNEEQQSRFEYHTEQETEPEQKSEQEPIEDAEFEEYTRQTTSGAGKVKNTSSFKDKAATAGRTVAQGSKAVAHATASAGGKVLDFSAGAIRVAGKTTHTIRQTPQKVDELFHSYETDEEREARLTKKAEKKAEKERLDTLAKERQIETNAKLQEEEAKQETLRRQQKLERGNQRNNYSQGTSVYNSYGGFGYDNNQRRGLFGNRQYSGYGGYGYGTQRRGLFGNRQYSGYGGYGYGNNYGNQRRGLFNRNNGGFGNRQPRQRASGTTLLLCGTAFLLALGYVLTLIIH